MQLLDVDTLQLKTFYGDQVPKYAILSHTWGAEEVTFTNIQTPTSPRTTSLAGFEKIRKTCEQAKIDQYQYAWVDTCCIDKSSSAELTEAINSMFQWYRDAGACYVFLSDVSEAEFQETFPRSRWFSRGWTLQELLAPSNVIFFDRDWHNLGTKDEHARWISDITGIDTAAILRHVYPGGLEFSLDQFCVAKRMSWASSRETTRVEDVAYCLLGIFNVNMPLLYGEGERAFIRLQEEIIRRCDDNSILAWDLDSETWDPQGLVPEVARTNLFTFQSSHALARSPKAFRNCRSLWNSNKPMTPMMLTNSGLQIELPLVAVNLPGSSVWVGLLSCWTDRPSKFVGIILCSSRRDDSEYYRVKFGTAQHSCVQVGPRAAAQAIQGKITVIEYSRSETDLGERYYHYIINESQSLLDMGYSVCNVSYNSMLRRGDLGHGTYDSTTKVFTIPDQNTASYSLLFSFKPQPGRPEFWALVAIHDNDRYINLMNPGAEGEETIDVQPEFTSDAKDAVLRSADGGKCSLVFTPKEKAVAFCKIIEVGIDVKACDVVSRTPHPEPRISIFSRKR